MTHQTAVLRLHSGLKSHFNVLLKLMLLKKMGHSSLIKMKSAGSSNIQLIHQFLNRQLIELFCLGTLPLQFHLCAYIWLCCSVQDVMTFIGNDSKDNTFFDVGVLRINLERILFQVVLSQNISDKIGQIFSKSLAQAFSDLAELNESLNLLLDSRSSEPSEEREIYQLINSLQSLQLPQDRRVGMFQINCQTIRRRLSSKIRERIVSLEYV